jgi:hypothetical protein
MNGVGFALTRDSCIVLSSSIEVRGEKLLLKHIVVPKKAPSEHEEVCRLQEGSQNDLLSSWSNEEEEETTSATDDNEFSILGDFAPHPIPKFVSVLIQNMPKEPLQACLDNRDWRNLTALVKDRPEVCRQSINILF